MYILLTALHELVLLQTLTCNESGRRVLERVLVISRAVKDLPKELEWLFLVTSHSFEIRFLSNRHKHIPHVVKVLELLIRVDDASKNSVILTLNEIPYEYRSLHLVEHFISRNVNARQRAAGDSGLCFPICSQTERIHTQLKLWAHNAGQAEDEEDEEAAAIVVQWI